jgi:hypothetical protein
MNSLFSGAARLGLAAFVLSAALLASPPPATAGLSTLHLAEQVRPSAGRSARLVAHGIAHDILSIELESVTVEGGTVYLDTEADRYPIFPRDSNFAFGFDLPPLPAGDYQVVHRARTKGTSVVAEEARTVLKVGHPLTVNLVADGGGSYHIEAEGQDDLDVRFEGKPVVAGDTITAGLAFESFCNILCIPGPFPFFAVSESFGPLPAGSYRVELRDATAVYPRASLLWREDREMLEGLALVRGGRFEIAIELDPPHSAPARLVEPPSADSALFYFFSPDNWEVMVKVLDGCALNGHYWVYGAASTDVGYTVRVTDRQGDGGVKEYRHDAGTPAPALTDGAAFPCE